VGIHRASPCVLYQSQRSIRKQDFHPVPKNQGAIGAMPGRLISSHPTNVARSTCHTVHQWELLSAQCCSNLVLTPRLWLKTRYPSKFRNRWDMDISFPKNMAKNTGLDPSQSLFFLLTCISPSSIHRLPHSAKSILGFAEVFFVLVHWILCWGNCWGITSFIGQVMPSVWGKIQKKNAQI